MPNRLLRRLFPRNVDPSTRVAVVGAGFAGIGAARALKKAGVDVVVIEARDRLGGRADTRHDFGHPVDLGASWLHGGARNPLKALARSLGVALAPTDYNNIEILGETGGLVTDLATRSLNRALAKDLRNALLRRDYERSMAEVFAGAPASLAKTVAVRGFESEYASPIRELGVASVVPRTKTNGLGPKEDRPEQFVTGGMGTFLARLADGLDVRLSEPVRAVSTTSGSAVVVTGRGEHVVDGVVVTVSLGVLKRDVITFDPVLPAIHREALARVSMGTMNKVALRFPRTIWPDRDAFAVPSALVFSFWNMARYVGEPTLVGLVGGDEAIELERLSEDERIDRCYRELRAWIPDLPEPTQGLVTDWSTDSWSYGAYSRLPPGGRGTEPKILAKPVGDRLVLAGEATHRHDPATVHGAFLSGERAARDLLAAM